MKDSTEQSGPEDKTAPQVKKNFFLCKTHNLLTESTGNFIPYKEYLLLWIIIFSIL